jgi:hypothetical protein
VKRPLVARQTGPKCVLELAMGPLHHAIALWVEGSHCDVVDAQSLAEKLPDMSCELGTLVCCHRCRHAEQAIQVERKAVVRNHATSKRLVSCLKG